jgi:hypothetical protein
MRDAFHELDAFKRISFKNMAGCYREELERPLRGEITIMVLTHAG